MKTVGQILSEKRNQLGLSLLEVEKETKIRRKYLEAIEKDDFSFIPEITVVKGFIRNYSQFLGLLPENALAIFRRDFPEKYKDQIVPQQIIETVENEKMFRWTPKLTLIVLTALVLLAISFFAARQYLYLSSAPPLQLFSPQEKEIIKGVIEVYGKTDKDAAVKIDNIPVPVSEDGGFKEEIVLPKGENVITIEAVNRQGKKRVLNRQVVVE